MGALCSGKANNPAGLKAPEITQKKLSTQKKAVSFSDPLTVVQPDKI